jgi:hypothetical protein
MPQKGAPLWPRCSKFLSAFRPEVILFEMPPDAYTTISAMMVRIAKNHSKAESDSLNKNADDEWESRWWWNSSPNGGSCKWLGAPSPFAPQDQKPSS